MPTEPTPPAVDVPPDRPARRRRGWRGPVITVLATLGVVAGTGAILSRNPKVRQWAVERLQDPPPPEVNPHLGKVDGSLRQILLGDRDRAAARGDLTAAAAINGTLGHEALLRADATQRAWINLRKPNTRLFPERAPLPVWEYKDVASDCFGFLIQAGIRLNPGSIAVLNDTFAAETTLAPPGELCQGVNAATGEKLPETVDQRMFGSTEYVKDGLLSVYERYGDHPAGTVARDRMFQVLDVVLAKSAHASKFGPIPGEGSEENGNVLQACSRLSFSAPNGPAYAEMAARIADAYVQQVLPKNNGLAARQFDFKADKVERFGVRIRDHGNEIIPGLAEAYALSVARQAEPNWKARADRWADPVAKMYETLLTRCLDADGLLQSAVDGRDFTNTAPEPNDNWAYVLNGAFLFTQAARKHGTVPAARLDALDAAADKVIGNVARQYGVAWESGRMDGYADTLESGIYMIAHRPTSAAALEPWVDDQIGKLFAYQLPGGTVNGDYLDGNFIRTCLLYADLRAGGWTADAWRPDVRVGFAVSADKSEAVVHVQCGDKPWTGVLRPDRLRHQEIMKLPWDWPRLNSWPQHFVPAAGDAATAADGMPPPTPEQLRSGVPVTLPANGRASFKIKLAPR